MNALVPMIFCARARGIDQLGSEHLGRMRVLSELPFASGEASGEGARGEKPLNEILFWVFGTGLPPQSWPGGGFVVLPKVLPPGS